MELIEKEYASVVKRQASSTKRILSSIDNVLQKLRGESNVSSSTSTIESVVPIRSNDDRSTSSSSTVLLPWDIPKVHGILASIKDDHKIVHASISKLSKTIDSMKKSTGIEVLTVPCFTTDVTRTGLHLAIIDYYIRKGSFTVAEKLATIFHLPLPTVAAAVKGPIPPLSDTVNDTMGTKTKMHPRTVRSIGSTVSFADVLTDIRNSSSSTSTDRSTKKKKNKNNSSDASSPFSSSSPDHDETETVNVPLTDIFSSLYSMLEALQHGNTYPLLRWITKHRNELQTIFSSVPIPETFYASDKDTKTTTTTNPSTEGSITFSSPSVHPWYPLSPFPTVNEFILTLRMIHIQQILLGRLYVSPDEYLQNEDEKVSKAPTMDEIGVSSSPASSYHHHPCLAIRDSHKAVAIALAYAREYLLPYLTNTSLLPSSRTHPSIQKLIGSFIYITDARNSTSSTNETGLGDPTGGTLRTVSSESSLPSNSTIPPPYNPETYYRLKRSPYGHLYPSSSNIVTDTLLPSVIRYYYGLFYGIAYVSSFEQILTVHRHRFHQPILQQLYKYAKMCKDTGGNYPYTGTLLNTAISGITGTGTTGTIPTTASLVPSGKRNEVLPIEGIPLYHSIFACPVTRQACTIDTNPPILLPCGHVLSQKSMETLVSNRGTAPLLNRTLRFKCPTCPSLQNTSQTVMLVLD